MARRDTVVGISSTTEIWKIKSAERSPTSLRLQQCGELSLGNLNLFFFPAFYAPSPAGSWEQGTNPKLWCPDPPAPSPCRTCLQPSWFLTRKAFHQKHQAIKRGWRGEVQAVCFRGIPLPLSIALSSPPACPSFGAEAASWRAL